MMRRMQENLEEEIYIRILPGFSGASDHKVRWLKRALYGLNNHPELCLDGLPR